MALEVGGLFLAQDLPDYLYSQVEQAVNTFDPSEPSDLPASMQSLFMTRADFLQEVRTRIDSLFSIWYVQSQKLGYAPYLLTLLADVWTMMSRCRICVLKISHGRPARGGAVIIDVDSETPYKVIFKVGSGTVAGRPLGADLPEQNIDVLDGYSPVNPRMPTIVIKPTVESAKEGFTPTNIASMPENYLMYSLAESINNGALKKGQLIAVSPTLKQLCSSFATMSIELSNKVAMPHDDAFSSNQNIPGLGTYTTESGETIYSVPGFISTNNAATYGVYTCHSNCHSSCHGNRSRR